MNKIPIWEHHFSIIISIKFTNFIKSKYLITFLRSRKLKEENINRTDEPKIHEGVTRKQVADDSRIFFFRIQIDLIRFKGTYWECFRIPEWWFNQCLIISWPLHNNTTDHFKLKSTRALSNVNGKLVIVPVNKIHKIMSINVNKFIPVNISFRLPVNNYFYEENQSILYETLHIMHTKRMQGKLSN